MDQGAGRAAAPGQPSDPQLPGLERPGPWPPPRRAVAAGACVVAAVCLVAGVLELHRGSGAAAVGVSAAAAGAVWSAVLLAGPAASREGPLRRWLVRSPALVWAALLATSTALAVVLAAARGSSVGEAALEGAARGAGLWLVVVPVGWVLQRRAAEPGRQREG